MGDADLRTAFHSELHDIRVGLSQLASSVIEDIPLAATVLLEGDLDLANRMVLADREFDIRALELEERCYQLLALQAPVASDLRQIIAAVKIIGDVERSGDLTVNICKAARRIHGHELDAPLRSIIARMCEQTQQLFRSAVDAYLTADVPLASAIGDMDDLLDDLQRELILQIFNSHANGRIDLQVGIQLALVARFFERLGDHAVNIGNRVRYMVTGWLYEGDVVVKSRFEPLTDELLAYGGAEAAPESEAGGAA